MPTLSNITIATICLAIFSVCGLLGGIFLFLSELRQSRKEGDPLAILVAKLKELRDLPSCGPSFVKDKFVSIEWLLKYIQDIQD